MRPFAIGVLLGITNVAVNAILYGLLEDPRGAGFVAFYGIVPGMIAGAIIGAIAGATKDQARWLHAIGIAVPAALTVAGLGVIFGITDFIPIALVPTLALCALLEWHTYDAEARVARAMLDPPLPDLRQRSAAKLSMVLGAAVMLIVLAGISTNRPCGHTHWFELYTPWGAVIGVALAAPFGVLADCTHRMSGPLRAALLLTLGLALTGGLGVLTQRPDAIPLAFIPVAASCLLLERYSRRPAPVPTAIARA